MLILLISIVSASPATEILGENAKLDNQSYKSGSAMGWTGDYMPPVESNGIMWIWGLILGIVFIGTFVFLKYIRHM